ncbi:MAG: methyltransferase family protein [Candidatus Hodarchaeota archaeon]
MGLFERMLNTIFSIIITVFFVGLFCYFIPRWILDWDFLLFPLEIGVFRFIGLVPIILGVVTMIGFIWGWILSGTGTPLQFDTPKELIVRGSYRFVRNPMYVGYCLIMIGEVLLFKSSVLVLYFLVLFLFLHMFVVFVEEPMLKLKFGESYEQYCKSVPRWVPRLKAYRTGN